MLSKLPDSVLCAVSTRLNNFCCLLDFWHFLPNYLEMSDQNKMEERQNKEMTADFQFGERDLQNITFSDTSSENEEDTITQKIGSWKILLTHLQKELHSEKVKTRGQTAIINSFKELKAENNYLKENLKKNCDAVLVLQNRLAKFGADTSVQLGDDFLLPGPSKQVLDSLAEENIQLKKSLKYVAVDPSRVDKLQKQCQVVEAELVDCQRRCKKLESENKRLQELLNSSDSAKDIEILTLRRKILDLQSNKDTQNILCQSLSDETDDLRGRLRETVRQCQQLEQRLTSTVRGWNPGQMARSRPVQHMTGEAEQAGAVGGVDVSGSLTGQPDQNMGALQTLVTKQEAEIREVTEMNMKWQRYNDQREEHVRKMQKKLTETEDKLAKCRNAAEQEGGGGITEEQQEQIDHTILQYKRKVEMAEEEKQQIEDENRILKTRLASLQADVVTKEQEIAVLKGHVQVLSNRESMPTGSLADQEKITLLEQQITIWREDFNNERQDREKAVSRASKLETELHFVRRQLEQFQGQQMEQFAARRQQSLSNQERQYQGQNYMPQDMMSRGVRYETDGEDTVDGQGLYNDTLKGAHGPSKGSSSQHGFIPEGTLPLSSKEDINNTGPHNYNLKTEEESEDTLECPKCHLVFPVSRHFELLDHINECC